MNVPKRFDLLEEEWTVQYKWNLRLNRVKVDGFADLDARVIWIDRSLDKEDKWWTFFHEWIHALYHVYGVGFNSIVKDKKLTLQEAYDIEEYMIRAQEKEMRKVFKTRWKVKAS